MNQNNVEVSCCAFRPIITQMKPSPPRTARQDQRAKGEEERRRETCALRVPLYKGCYRQLRTLIPPPTSNYHQTTPQTTPLLFTVLRSFYFDVISPRFCLLIALRVKKSKSSRQNGECFVVIINVEWVYFSIELCGNCSVN